MRQKLFVSHSSKDKPFVKELIKELKLYDLDLWVDEYEIKIGDSLIEQIGEGLANAQYLIIVLSSNSVKSSWVREELNYFLMSQIEGGKARVLPILIEDCAIPTFLRDKYYLDLREWRNYNQFKVSIDKLISDLDIVKTIRHRKTGMEFVRIPSGVFLTGSEKKRVFLEEYWIGKFPVKIEEFMVFLEYRLQFSPRHMLTGGHSPSHIEVPDGYPWVGANQWFVGREYAKWANLRFPSVHEWEKAARGVDGRTYPWGENNLGKFCNTIESGIKDLTPVNSFPDGQSVFGCWDMIGNVSELTNTWTGEELNQWSSYYAMGGNYLTNLSPCYIRSRQKEKDGARYVGYRFVVDNPTEDDFLI